MIVPLAMIYWDPNPEVFSIPFIDFPILWYGVFFAGGFWLAFLLFVRILCRYFQCLPGYQAGCVVELKQKAQKIADQLTLYVVIGTILGARLGHFLFYEEPFNYLSDPLEFFRFRNGGLASHGALIGIVLAVVLFSRKMRATHSECDWVRILDFLALPAALAGCLIRIGNFFNQEILGTFSNLPWAIVFGHPADGGPLLARHPAQLYEALGYFAIFCLLRPLYRKPSFLQGNGKLIGIFLILVFSFRFVIEFLKLEQSHIFNDSCLTMGQILSIPAVVLGGWFYLRDCLEKRST